MSERGVELVPENLLRGHVGGRADAGAGLREVVVIEGLVPGDAEVHDLHPAVAGQHDVRRLDIPVHDAAVVDVVQGAGHLHGDDGRDVVRNAPARVEQVIQVDALHVLHDDEERAALLVEVVDVDDVLVLQVRKALGLAFEPGDELLLALSRGFEGLNSHRAVQGVLDRAVDHGHPAGGHLVHDAAVAYPFEHSTENRV